MGYVAKGGNIEALINTQTTTLRADLSPVLKEYYIEADITKTNLQKSDDTEYTTQNTAFVKATEFTLNPTGIDSIKTPITLHIYFEMKNSQSGVWSRAEIYKNGVTHADGVTHGTSNNTFQPKEETLEFAIGDTIELWHRTENAIRIATVRYFRIYADIYTKQGVVTW